MQLEEFVKCVQESGIVKDQGTIQRLFDALTVGRYLFIWPITLKAVRSLRFFYLNYTSFSGGRSLLCTLSLKHVRIGKSHMHTLTGYFLCPCPSSSLFPSKYLFFGLNITSLFLEGFAVQLSRHNQSFTGQSLPYDLFLFAVYFLHILEVFSVGTEVTFSVKEASVHKVQVVPQSLIWQLSCWLRFFLCWF